LKTAEQEKILKFIGVASPPVFLPPFFLAFSKPIFVFLIFSQLCCGFCPLFS
jgi:hypothetical protein